MNTFSISIIAIVLTAALAAVAPIGRDVQRHDAALIGGHAPVATMMAPSVAA